MATTQLREAGSAVRPQFGSWIERRYFLTFLVVVACYGCFGKGFAYFGIPPVGSAELMLPVGIIITVVVWNGAFLATVCTLPGVTLVMLMLWSAGCALPYRQEYGPLLVLRDWMVVGYGTFAFIVASFLIHNPSLLREWILRYRAFIPYQLLLLTVMSVLTLAIGDSLAWPNSGQPIFAMKPTDAAVQLTGAALFAIVGLCRLRLVFLLLMAAMIIGTAAITRGGASAFFLSTFIAACLVPAGAGRRQYFLLLAFLCVVICCMAYLDIQVTLSTSDRTVSARQLLYNAMSIVGNSGQYDLTEGTKEWRLEWWHQIISYTVHGRYFWFGKGFGINLADADGFQVTDDLASLRSPHSVNMTMLARAGVPGLALWVTALLSWLVIMGHRFIIAYRNEETIWLRLFAFLMCFWLAFLVNASFDVALEGPTDGIWFWTLHGIGIAAAMIHRSEHLQLQAVIPEWSRLKPKVC